MSNISTSLKKTNYLTRRRLGLIFLVALLHLLLINYFGNFMYVGLQHLAYMLLGIVGAIFANSTGAGGGVVFIPVFAHLGFSEAQAISTSFGIQCFGMTAGAITWCIYYRGVKQYEAQAWQEFLPVVAIGSIFSIVGLWYNYTAQLAPPAALHEIFSVFSILLGLSILATIFLLRPGASRYRLEFIDLIILAVITFAGGLITAWLSVGVGEIVAFYLILRRFDVTMAVAAAVVISAITVWSAAPQHFWFNSEANWQVLAFAGPGAILGGILARNLVGHFSARRLKIFFGVWLLIIGLAS